MSQRNNQVKPDVEELARRALEWYETDDGRRSAQQADERVEATEKLLNRGYEIKPTKLYDPFTV